MNKKHLIGKHVVFLNGDIKGSYCGRIIEINEDKALIGITKSINQYEFYDAAWVEDSNLRLVGAWSDAQIKLAKTMAMF